MSIFKIDTAGIVLSVIVLALCALVFLDDLLRQVGLALGFGLFFRPVVLFAALILGGLAIASRNTGLVYKLILAAIFVLTVAEFLGVFGY